MPTVEEPPRVPTGPVVLSAAESREKGESDLLIDTMQLVEPYTTKTVPNHLLETKLYNTLIQTPVIKAKPSSVLFQGFQLDKLHVQKLTIVNAAAEVISMHIIPPQTKHFYLRYTKPDRMVPGLTLECTVEFLPDEWRYYYDCIRISCPGEENLIIPIHAYPVMATKEFPEVYSFPPTPVGHSVSKSFPLRSDIPIDFEFQLNFVQSHPFFKVDPMEGIVPANGEITITVTYAPLEFQTATMRLELLISQFNMKPVVGNFFGTSTPGLLWEKTKKDLLSNAADHELLDPQCLTPLGRVKAKRQHLKSSGSRPIVQKPREIECEGIKFPANLNTPFAVAQVLNQEAGKIRAKDIREKASSEALLKRADSSETTNRQMREARFEHMVRRNVYEERQNQLRWQIRLGSEPISSKDKSRILDSRSRAWNEYIYVKRGDPVGEDEQLREKTNTTFRRTYRRAEELSTIAATFDIHENDKWERRHMALNAFVQSARKVIVRTRAKQKLQSLRQAVQEWKKKYASNIPLDQLARMEEEENAERSRKGCLGLDTMCAKRVATHKFMQYVPPNEADDLGNDMDEAPDALGLVPVTPTEVIIKTQVPFFRLKVPQYFKLNGYRPFNVQETALNYISPKQLKELRSGAEDEVISLPKPTMIVDSALNLDTAEYTYDDEDTHFQLTLVPPEDLFLPITYPFLHIFNPAPGLQVFLPPMPYAEVDPDFHLCPLPCYSRKDHQTLRHAATQRRFLSREDVIRGVMSWKKFPSQGLTSLSNTPTLTGVWVPRWEDPFCEDLLPTSVPLLYDGLSEEDRENVEELDEADNSLLLTPEMVSGHFAMLDQTPLEEQKVSDMFPMGSKMPASNIPVGPLGPVPREKREEELEFFINKRYNRLGSKISNRLQTLNSATNDVALAK